VHVVLFVLRLRLQEYSPASKFVGLPPAVVNQILLDATDVVIAQVSQVSVRSDGGCVFIFCLDLWREASLLVRQQASPFLALRILHDRSDQTERIQVNVQKEIISASIAGMRARKEM